MLATSQASSTLYGAKHMPAFIEVARKSQIPENGAIGVEVQGKRLALVNLSGEIYALDDDCPHEGGPLSEGQIVGEEIECPWHTSHFNIKTGRVTIDPATKNVPTYRVRLVGDAVEVEI
jgi:3-phenylpropionate/trans-cinnamate dioxygenase ferredoxin subunit